MMWRRVGLLAPLSIAITLVIFWVMALLIYTQQARPEDKNIVFEWGRTKLKSPPPQPRDREIEPPKKSKSKPASTAPVVKPSQPSRPVSPVGTAPVIPQELAGKTFNANNVGQLSLNTGFSGDGKSNIRAIKRFQPTYPPEAISNMVEGFVELEFTITKKGDVIDVVVIDAKPVGVFEKNAVAALKKWVFQPRKVAGQVVSTRERQRVEFGFVGG